MKNMRRMVSLLICLAIVDVAGVALASSAEEILRTVDQTMGSDTRVMEQKMILYTATGQERTRELRMYSDREAETDSMLVQFTGPADVRGTGLLMVGDDMWLYMPALGRTRRIAAHAKQGDFMGSEFSYNDMEQIGTRGFSEDFFPIWLDEEEVNGILTDKLKLNPENEELEYGYLQMWVDQERYLPVQIEYYDLQDNLLKVLTTDDYTLVDDRWTATRMQMENVVSGTRTVMEVEHVEFDAALDGNTFTTRFLERGL